MLGRFKDKIEEFLNIFRMWSWGVELKEKVEVRNTSVVCILLLKRLVWLKGIKEEKVL